MVSAVPTVASMRRALPADIPALAALLSQRDDRTWDDPSTSWFLHRLDPARCLGWIAFLGDKPVGMSTMFLRDLAGPSGRAHAGYWANLYIDPAHRDLLLYPRFPLLMFATAKELGLEFIYGSVRHADLVEAHARLGFASLGRLPVLALPLRPLRLLSRYKRWPALTSLSPPFDVLYAGLALRRARPVPGITIETVDPDPTSLVEILNAASARRMSAVWTEESLRYRYDQTREGTRYFLASIRRGGVRVGGLVYRFAERWGGIRGCVVMDAILPEGEEPLIEPALRSAQAHALSADCDLMMFLDGLGPAISSVFASLGYRASPESYEMILWPNRKAKAEPRLATTAGWRFGFGDHDAF